MFPRHNVMLCIELVQTCLLLQLAQHMQHHPLLSVWEIAITLQFLNQTKSKMFLPIWGWCRYTWTLCYIFQVKNQSDSYPHAPCFLCPCMLLCLWFTIPFSTRSDNITIAPHFLSYTTFHMFLAVDSMGPSAMM